MIYMHRLITNAPYGLLVDHINGDCLDNRKANLRLATNAQNNYNKRPLNSFSKYKGVFFIRKEKRWTATIGLNHKKIYLGNFKDEIKAAKAYDTAAKKYYGQFAYLNFPKIKPKGLRFVLHRAYRVLRRVLPR